MLLNNLKISLRHLLKNRTFTLINLAGLTLGFLCFTLLSLYLHDELNFDTFHPDADRIVRVMEHQQQEDGSIRNIAQVSPLLGSEADSQFEEVEESCRLTAFGRITLGNDPTTRSYERTWSVSDNYFQFFNFPLAEGDPATALKTPDGIVISESFGKRYFGKGPYLGKQIWSTLRRQGVPVTLTVTGVMKDLPRNSHIQLELVFSEHTWPSMFRWYNEYVTTDWESNEYVTYLKVKTGTDTEALAANMADLVKSHYPKDKTFKSTFTLQPLTDLHFYTDNAQDNELNSNSIKPFYLYMFGAVGMLLLLIACLNYMNLSTAAAFKRTREMGTRRTLGAQKRQLIGQFLTDALVLSVFSMLLAVVFTQALLPAVNSFTNKEMALPDLPVSWMVLTGGVMLAAALLSSAYPAFVVTRVPAVEALKKEIRIANSSVPVRKLLLVAQFTISIIMIASTLIIYRQLTFMREKDLGFDRENLLVIDINSQPLRRNFETVKTEFSRPAEVQSITVSTRVPGEWKSFPVATVTQSANTPGHEMIFVGIDKDFLKTYKIKLLEGRTIDDPVADSLKVVLTQLAAEQLGLDNPVGQVLEIPATRRGGSNEPLEQPFRVEVIGVVENFHFESLRAEMMPVIFGAPNTTIQRIDYYTLRINTANWEQTLATLKEINTKIDPDNPLEYTFLESRFEDIYAADTKRGQIFLTLSIVVVVIACMGLFALVSYSVESRTKEIGVRKVLGASVNSIVGMISKEFLILVGLACMVAMPVSFFFMSEWLKDFAYRISLGAGSFVVAGLLAAVIAFATISLRTLVAATENPVKSLRSE
ncbi:ABC transporter permease [Oscillatoria amoena NRMC-F 0135]|nr:ABC transporter permease [Oscillatoria amoena NRMC-F 0135]